MRIYPCRFSCAVVSINEHNDTPITLLLFCALNGYDSTSQNWIYLKGGSTCVNQNQFARAGADFEIHWMSVLQSYIYSIYLGISTLDALSLQLVCTHGRQAWVHQVVHIEWPAQWPGVPVTLLYGSACVSEEPKTNWLQVVIGYNILAMYNC